MESRRVFTVGPKRVKHVADIGSFFYPGKKIISVPFSEADCFKKMSDEELNTIVFVGPSSATEYGEYTTKEFIATLIRVFPVNKKYLLTDLYLIGSDVGVVHEGKSMAQEIVDGLNDAGFYNATLHAIAKPEHASGCMYIEEANFGHLNAFLLSEKDSERFDELNEDNELNADEINKLIKKHASYFIHNAHPYEELNKERNTFKAKESLLARRKRIGDVSLSALDEEKSTAMFLLNARREHEQQKGNTVIAQKLDIIIKKLEPVSGDAWMKVIQKFFITFKSEFLGIHINKRSNTLKLLKHLSVGDIPKAKAIIEAQKDQYSLNFHLEASVTKRKIKESPDQKDLHIWLLFIKAKDKISALMNDLENEMRALSQGCFSFFHRFEINTKIKKRDALGDLLLASDFSDLQCRASNLILADNRVLRSFKTQRTRDLLHKIVHSPEDLFKGDLTYPQAATRSFTTIK